MIETIKRIHRFLLNEAFYPLALSSLVCLGVFAVRVYFSGSRNYSNLVWNLILAWIPYVVSLAAVLFQRSFLPRSWWGWVMLLPFAGVWILFFPNAPYIVTDFYHLMPRPPLPLWFDIGLISLFAFSGCFLAVASLRSMHSLMRRYFGRILGWLGITAAITISAVGVYLGRFGRWNSWDLFTSPRAVLREAILPALSPYENPGFIGFTLLFTALLLVLYLMFVSLNQRVEEEVPNR